MKRETRLDKDLREGFQSWIDQFILCRRNNWEPGKRILWESIKSVALRYSKRDRKRLSKMLMPSSEELEENCARTAS